MPPRNPNAKKAKKDRLDGTLGLQGEGKKIGGIAGASEAAEKGANDKNRAQTSYYISNIMTAIKDNPDLVVESIIEKNAGEYLADTVLKSMRSMDPKTFSLWLLKKVPPEALSNISSELGASVRKESFASGIELEFNTVIIDSSEILTKTVVSSLNHRGYSAKNEDEISDIEVSDIMATIDSKQEVNAIGFMGKDGLIHIVDGSRRRLACIKLGLRLVVDVADKEIDALTLSYIIEKADSANKSKREFNPLEKGLFYKDLIELGYSTEQIAERYGFTTDRMVKTCLGFTEIDNDVINLAYSRSCLGKDLTLELAKVDKLLKSLEDDVKTSLWSEIIAFREEALKDERYDLSRVNKDSVDPTGAIKRNNGYLIKGIVEFLATEKGYNTLIKAKKAKSAPSSLDKAKYKPLLSKAMGRSKMKVEFKSGKEGNKDVSLIKFTNFTEDDLKDALAYIESKHAAEEALQ